MAQPRALDVLSEIDKTCLEFIFACDLVQFIIERKYARFALPESCQHGSPVTPFSYRIRNAVEHYLCKEQVNMYFMFADAFRGVHLTNEGFADIAENMKNFCPKLDGTRDLLRFCTVMGQYSMMACNHGARFAPVTAVLRIRDSLLLYAAAKKLSSQMFWESMNYQSTFMMVDLAKRAPDMA